MGCIFSRPVILSYCRLIMTTLVLSSPCENHAWCSMDKKNESYSLCGGTIRGDVCIKGTPGSFPNQANRQRSLHTLMNTQKRYIPANVHNKDKLCTHAHTNSLNQQCPNLNKEENMGY